ncbi:hypothetical protein IFM89_010210 [Coptis chinensis]|uniref:Pyruvate kinase n=1 Tax=Coptis chinensis TaxID=261450 RepID=A0A835GVS1_9MAGN|nr:hypothetical protein IFM89_010210 [Coptis chinensis]
MRCYCPSEEVAKRALLDGLESSQIRVFGLPIRPSFCCAIISKDQLRDELEMDPKLPAVLLMGGGEGMGPVKKTAKALGDALFDESMGRPIGQVVVICGRNKSLSSILIALGDLAVECGWVRLADIQEEIISICGAAHIPVIWATQVLESLVKSGLPTRAEITDVANGRR